MNDIAELPTEEVKVVTQPSTAATAIGTKEWCDAMVKEMKAGPAWRTPAGLASKMGCDAADLVKWMDRQPEIARKPGKDDGVFYYGFVAKEPERKGPTRPAITEEDRYCAALLHSIYGQLLDALNKYALRIHDKSEEGFKALMNARDRLSAGTVLFHHATHVDPEKLPKL